MQMLKPQALKPLMLKLPSRVRQIISEPLPTRSLDPEVH
jgi:hypothetical protein